jgi:hypothetical protein
LPSSIAVFYLIKYRCHVDSLHSQNLNKNNCLSDANKNRLKIRADRDLSSDGSDFAAMVIVMTIAKITCSVTGTSKNRPNIRADRDRRGVTSGCPVARARHYSHALVSLVVGKAVLSVSTTVAVDSAFKFPGPSPSQAGWVVETVTVDSDSELGLPAPVQVTSSLNGLPGPGRVPGRARRGHAEGKWILI